MRMLVLPHPSLRLSALCLSRKDADRQIRDCLRIIQVLQSTSESKKQHPAVSSWDGCLFALLTYACWCCHRYYVLAKKAHRLQVPIYEQKSIFLKTLPLVKAKRGPVSPWWVDRVLFFQNCRRILLHRDPTWYKKCFKGTRVPASRPETFWPVKASHWKIEKRKLLVLKKAWKKTQCTVDIRTHISSRKIAGSSMVRYFLQEGGRVDGKQVRSTRKH